MTSAYVLPLRDFQFVLHELLAGEEVVALPGNEEFTPDLVDSVLSEAGRFGAQVLQPLNRSGDEQGCALEAGRVSTPEGFRGAYRQYREAGWTGLACDPAYGGQGLPHTVATAVREILCACNLSFSMYPGLSQGAYLALHEHGSDEQRARYLKPLIDGTSCGTMCLTEPQCGTDLGLVRTTATPRADGSYRLQGNKMFISAGEHDLTDNILHLVLARTPDAPAGIRGISLFLVPKLLVGADGAPGERNGVECIAIEHKMGIRASATCALAFDGAVGYLVGTLNKGMRAMFTMMNAARLAVGTQGLGLAEAAYQGAVRYARERRQGQSPGAPPVAGGQAEPILVHPDVRRMLLTMRAYVEGSRMLTLMVAARLEIAGRHPDQAERRRAEEFVSLLTPVVKAMVTDIGSEVTNLGVQVYGGHGYIRDNGMEQLVRDARIGQIYEGTNGVQALDLVGRKLPARAGGLLRHFFHPVDAYLARLPDDPELRRLAAPVGKAFGRLQRATGWVARQGARDPAVAGAAASEYLRLFGLVAMAYLWLRAVELSAVRAGGPEDEAGFYAAKRDTARFYVEHLLPQTEALFASIMAGGETARRFDDRSF